MDNKSTKALIQVLVANGLQSTKAYI